MDCTIQTFWTIYKLTTVTLLIIYMFGHPDPSPDPIYVFKTSRSKNLRNFGTLTYSSIPIYLLLTPDWSPCDSLTYFSSLVVYSDSSVVISSLGLLTRQVPFDHFCRMTPLFLLVGTGYDKCSTLFYF